MHLFCLLLKPTLLRAQVGFLTELLLGPEDWMFLIKSASSFPELPSHKTPLTTQRNALNSQMQCLGLWDHLPTSAQRPDACWAVPSPYMVAPELIIFPRWSGAVMLRTPNASLSLRCCSLQFFPESSCLHRLPREQAFKGKISQSCSTIMKLLFSKKYFT